MQAAIGGRDSGRCGGQTSGTKRRGKQFRNWICIMVIYICILVRLGSFWIELRFLRLNPL